MLPQPRLNDAQYRLVELMLDTKIEFLVIGEHAMRVNGAIERVTKDLDVVLNVGRRGATALANYFKTFHSALNVQLVVDAILSDRPQQIPFAVDGVHEADLMTQAKGMHFQEMQFRSVAFGDQVLPVVMRLEAIQLKKAVLQSESSEAIKQKHQKDIEVLLELERIDPQNRSPI